VYNGVTQALVASFLAYGPNFTGGVFVGAGDVNGDSFADIITGAGANGGPHVKVFDGVTRAERLSFFAFDPTYLGGVDVTAADRNGDGKADVVVGPGAGIPPTVRSFRGTDGAFLGEFTPADPTFLGGVFVG